MTQNVTTPTTRRARPVDHLAVALAAPDAPTTEFAHLDPRALVVETNVRDEVAQDRSFIGSIRQHGVFMPILVVRHSDGTLKVRAGQRRTLGAILADAPTIPARIIDAGNGADRIVQQMIENEHREPLTEAQRAAGYAQMNLEFGMTAAQIAGRVGADKRTVSAALRLSRSTHAREAITAGLTIDQAAVIAAFDDDPEAVASLTRTALSDPTRLPHAVQTLRDRRAEARQIARLTEDLTSQGVTVLAARLRHDDPTAKVLDYLRDAEGDRIAPEEHTGCPGHGAYISNTYYDAEPTPVYLCTDWQANGHQIPDYMRATVSAPATGKMTDDQKAERRALIAGNKAWKSATTVRREWLAVFAKRRTAPKGAAMAYLTHACTFNTSALDNARADGHALALDLLGLTAETNRYGQRDWRTTLTKAITSASVGRAQIIALTVVLAAMETSTHARTWQRQDAEVAHYLRAIESYGYPLADIEAQAITGKNPNAPEPDQDPEVITDDEDQAPADEDTPDENGRTDDLDLSEYDAD